MNEFRELKVPIVDLPSAVRVFNDGKSLWCASESTSICRDIECEECIFCCNAGNPSEKIKAFGDYAIAHGHEITRPEYLAMQTAITIASDDDDDDDEDNSYTCECSYCGKRFDSDDEDAALCPDCQGAYEDGEIQYCDGCGRYYADEEGCLTADTNEYRCSECATDLYRCDDCGDYYVHYINVHTDDHENCICNDCYDDDWYTCEGCGSLIRAVDACWSNDSPYCGLCCPDDDSTIHDYGFKPNPEFRECEDECEADKGKFVYLGFELEAGNSSAYERDNAAEEIVEMTSLCYLKEDASIPACGFELVTHPLTYTYHKDCVKWNEILKVMENHGLKSHDASSSCGLHVHVNRDALNDNQWLIVDWFVHRFQSKWECIARRSDTHWCAFKKKDATASLKSTYGKGYDRYRAVNFSNRNTVEFRLFRGTLRYETLIGTLALVDGLIRWARIVKTHDLLKSGIWESYVKFLKSDDRYVVGLDYLKYRGITTD